MVVWGNTLQTICGPVACREIAPWSRGWGTNNRDCFAARTMNKLDLYMSLNENPNCQVKQ